MTLPLSYSRPPIQEAHYLYFLKPAQHKCGGGRIRTCVDPKVDGFTARCHWPLDHPSIRGRLGTGPGGLFLISLSFSWREESNPQPTDYKSVALPLSYASILLIYSKARPKRGPPNMRPPRVRKFSISAGCVKRGSDRAVRVSVCLCEKALFFQLRKCLTGRSFPLGKWPGDQFL